MKLREFKEEFLKKLEKEFPKEEVLSFFNILVEHYLQMSRIQVALDREKELSGPELHQMEAALERLMRHEPVQYIIGKKEFYGLNFMVNENVLIPRPETEELVDWILKDLQAGNKKKISILDIGTGSGCIAVSLAKNLPEAKVKALDFSAEALDVARKNAEDNAVEVVFVQADILKTEDLESHFDVIVSNPPYVRELEKTEMQRNVLEHEPEMALYVKDEDPLIFYRKITALAENALNPRGAIYFEINQYLEKETAALLQEKDFLTSLKKDIFGVERMLKGQKS